MSASEVQSSKRSMKMSKKIRTEAVDQLFEAHGRSRTWCRACGAVDLDFLCGGVLLSGDTLGECMHEADPGRYGAGMDSGE